MSSASESHRLVILTHEETDDLYGLPRFTENDRQLYFDLKAPEAAAVESRTALVGAYLVLELGYFKAKRQFFAFEPEAAADDLRHVLTRHFAQRPAVSIKPPSRNTRTVIQQTILELVGYGPWDGIARQALEDKARRTAMLSTQPLYILRETLQHLANERIVAPEYSTLQDMVGHAVTSATAWPGCSKRR